MKLNNLASNRIGQVPNTAGGFSYEVDQWTQLERFLILGSESGTYYITPQALTLQNTSAVVMCLKENPQRTVQIIRDISVSGRAARVDPAIFALAIAASPKYCRDTRYALSALPDVCRTGSHLFQFMSYILGDSTAKPLRGTGRSLRRAVGNWYLGRDIEGLQYQIAKYQQREGISHRDILRLTHPASNAADYNAVFKYVTLGELPEDFQDTFLGAVEWAKHTDSSEVVVALIHDFGLPWECVPTQWLRNADVRLALLRKMPIGALVRQLGLYSSLRLTEMKSEGESIILEALGDAEKLRRSRIHPFQLLQALHVYMQGRGERGSNTWSVNSRIVDALDAAFYTTFSNVESTEQRLLLGIDVSGSMTSNFISGLSNMPAVRGAAALALMMVNVEPYCDTVAFNTTATPRVLQKRSSLNDAMNTFRPRGNTDCGSVIDWAAKEEKVYDTILIFTDSETYHGDSNPWARFEAYRQTYNPNAKLVTVAMCSNRYTLGPQDNNILNAVGFDAALPALITDFIR